MPIRSIANRRLHRQIADQITRLIEIGEYSSGGRLPVERILANELAVNRPSAREALIAPGVEGRVDIGGGAGVFVMARQETTAPGAVPLDVSAHGSALPPGPFEVLYARGLIEPEVVALAAKRAAMHSHLKDARRRFVSGWQKE